MKRLNVLVIADLGGCPPHMFYESVARKYNIISYIPRPFAITENHAKLIENYSVAVIKDADFLNDISDFKHPESIYWAQRKYEKPEEVVVEDIIKVAKMFNVSAITTNNELFVVPMAKACEKLGLRGAGVQAAEKARDKNLMREAFNTSGVKSIKSKRVGTLEDFRKALEYIKLPAVLKPTYLASSIGVTFIHNMENAEELFLQVENLLTGIDVPKSVKYEAPFILEEYLIGDYHDWYTEEGYSDYISIEGLMVNKEYHPLVIHDKTPQIGFVETSHITSSILDEDAKKKIIEAAKKANEGLGLENCATHTEIKLMKNRELGIIESATRFAGWDMIPNIKKVYGVDAAEILVDVLCHGFSENLTNHLLDNPKKYVADFHLYPTDFMKTGEIDENQEVIIFNKITIPEGILVGDTEINSFSTVESGTKINLKLFEAFNSLANLHLSSSNSKDLVKSIKNIQNKASLSLIGDYSLV
ncbi:ATP-grasp domain-containing protein [Bacillus thuringiensis]|uniref:ATP-grasp domain-containing protein n=1 Tax=Bacillus thuringiensis TaxID=1428 RepID=UPI001FAC36A2